MPLIVKDRVKESTSTTGTGTVTLLGAVTGYQSFGAVGNLNQTYYCISDQGGANWEVGIGTYTASGTTLSRDTVLASSNAGALVSFAAGSKDVICSFPASEYRPEVWTPANTSPNGTSLPTAYLTMVATAYYDLYGFGQAAGQWQISAVLNFLTTVYSSGDVAAGTSKTINLNGVCANSSTYYWRVRYKDNNGVYSAWSAPTSFTTPASYNYSIDYIVMGGGAAGAPSNVDGDGGGAGQQVNGTTSALNSGTGYAITVGAGGTASTSGFVAGSASSIGAFATGNGAPATGNSGNGFAKGSGSTWTGGGGGGAAAVGGNGTYKGSGGNGGAGYTWLDGVQRGGGGGGGWYSLAGGGGAGGAGGGGGAVMNGGNPGTANTGSGGAGRSSSNSYGGTNAGGSGGSGIVILRYAGTTQIASGGTVTITGGYVYHTFTSSGTFTP